MKPTDKQIAEHFGTTTKTLYNWKSSKDPKINKRYEAFKDLYVMEVFGKKRWVWNAIKEILEIEE